MVQRRSILQAAVAAGLGSALPTARAQTTKTITFGGSIPLSGAQAQTGQNVLAGYQAAIKFFNEKLGGVKVGADTYKFDLQMFDDASDPQRASTLIQKQVDDGLPFFLGSFSSGIVLPTAAITERARRPMVQAGGGADQIFSRGFKYVFGMYPRASRQLIPLVRLLKAIESRPSTVVIVTTNDAYSRSQADAVNDSLKAEGFTVSRMERLPANVSDVSSVVSGIRADKPDVVICNTHEQESLLITQQLAATGTDVKLLFLALGPEVQSFRTALGKNADGLTGLQYWDPRVRWSDPYFGTSQAYFEWYKSTTDRAYAYQTVAASACIVCYAKAMQDAGSIDPQAVRDKLAALDFETMYGHIKFTPEGDGDPVLMGSSVGQLRNNGLDIVFPEKAATAKLVYPMPSWASRS